MNSDWLLGGGVMLRCFRGERLRLSAIDLSEFTSKLHVLNFFFLDALIPFNLFSGIMLLVLLKRKKFKYSLINKNILILLDSNS
jgi:hypothetical protein